MKVIAQSKEALRFVLTPESGAVGRRLCPGDAYEPSDTSGNFSSQSLQRTLDQRFTDPHLVVRVLVSQITDKGVTSSIPALEVATGQFHDRGRRQGTSTNRFNILGGDVAHRLVVDTIDYQ